MTMAGELSRTAADRYPSLVYVHETFRLAMPQHADDFGGVGLILDVQEWCTPLASRLADHPNGIYPPAAIDLLLPVITTVERLFTDHGWIHRDIDEDNVLVGAEGRLRLADLGIVHVMSQTRDYSHTLAAGKSGTLPPEARHALQYGEGEVRVDCNYNTWQLGRVLYRMLTGDAARVRDLRVIDPTTHWTRWDEIGDVALKEIVRGMTQPEPDQRVSLKVVQAQLQEWLERDRTTSTTWTSDQLEAVPAPPSDGAQPAATGDEAGASKARSSNRTTRLKALSAAGALVLVAVVLAGLISVAFNDGSPPPLADSTDQSEGSDASGASFPAEGPGEGTPSEGPTDASPGASPTAFPEPTALDGVDTSTEASLPGDPVQVGSFTGSKHCFCRLPEGLVQLKLKPVVTNTSESTVPLPLNPGGTELVGPYLIMSGEFGSYSAPPGTSLEAVEFAADNGEKGLLVPANPIGLWSTPSAWVTSFSIPAVEPGATVEVSSSPDNRGGNLVFDLPTPKDGQYSVNGLIWYGDDGQALFGTDLGESLPADQF